MRESSGEKRAQHLCLAQDVGICSCVQSEIRLRTPLCSLVTNLGYKGVLSLWKGFASILVKLPWSIIWVFKI